MTGTPAHARWLAAQDALLGIARLHEMAVAVERSARAAWEAECEAERRALVVKAESRHSWDGLPDAEKDRVRREEAAAGFPVSEAADPDTKTWQR